MGRIRYRSNNRSKRMKRTKKVNRSKRMNRTKRVNRSKRMNRTKRVNRSKRMNRTKRVNRSKRMNGGGWLDSLVRFLRCGRSGETGPHQLMTELSQEPPPEPAPELPEDLLQKTGKYLVTGAPAEEQAMTRLEVEMARAEQAAADRDLANFYSVNRTTRNALAEMIAERIHQKMMMAWNTWLTNKADVISFAYSEFYERIKTICGDDMDKYIKLSEIFKGNLPTSLNETGKSELLRMLEEAGREIDTSLRIALEDAGIETDTSQNIEIYMYDALDALVKPYHHIHHTGPEEKIGRIAPSWTSTRNTTTIQNENPLRFYPLRFSGVSLKLEYTTPTISENSSMTVIPFTIYKGKPPLTIYSHIKPEIGLDGKRRPEGEEFFTLLDDGKLAWYDPRANLSCAYAYVKLGNSTIDKEVGGALAEAGYPKYAFIPINWIDLETSINGG